MLDQRVPSVLAPLSLRDHWFKNVVQLIAVIGVPFLRNDINLDLIVALNFVQKCGKNTRHQNMSDPIRHLKCDGVTRARHKARMLA
jgi:hypothetical protein